MSKPADSFDVQKPGKPGSTRARLLDLAYREIYESGFAGLRIDTLIDKAGSTKGAFYHHFPSKAALGYAVIDEILADFGRTVWHDHLLSFDDPIEGIAATVTKAIEVLGPHCLEFGCPINNLAQEMSAADPGFRDRTAAIFTQITGDIATALRRGQENGFVRGDIDPETTASFVFASIEGALSLTKAMGAGNSFDRLMAGFTSYLESLRPAG